MSLRVRSLISRRDIFSRAASGSQVLRMSPNPERKRKESHCVSKLDRMQILDRPHVCRGRDVGCLEILLPAVVLLTSPDSGFIDGLCSRCQLKAWRGRGELAALAQRLLSPASTSTLVTSTVADKQTDRQELYSPANASLNRTTLGHANRLEHPFLNPDPEIALKSPTIQCTRPSTVCAGPGCLHGILSALLVTVKRRLERHYNMQLKENLEKTTLVGRYVPRPLQTTETFSAITDKL